MLTNAEIKRIKSLKEKKFRDEFGQFVVEGEKLVEEALSSGFRVLAVYREEEVGKEAMERMSHLTSPSPVLALVEKPAPKGVVLERGLYIGLDAIRDPGNFGTILRLTDWFGISTVFASMDCVEVFNPKVVQASMGSVFRVEVLYCDLPDICRRFRRMDLPVYGTFLDGSDIYEQSLADEGLILFGNEANGIGPEAAAEVSSRILIPSYKQGPTAESLNVATATAIVLSEFRRRCR
ncbi:MAG: RNA methyltransferase [Bacteroidales bacterium]|nr:RNA methyltransferase [Bacteroidales bacterium]